MKESTGAAETKKNKTWIDDTGHGQENKSRSMADLGPTTPQREL